VYFKIIIKKISFLRKSQEKFFNFKKKFFVKNNFYVLKEKSKSYDISLGLNNM